MKPLLILGATSGIARAFCDEAVRHGYRLLLAGRSLEGVERIARDLEIRHGLDSIPCFVFDAVQPETHFAFFRQVLEKEPDLEGCFISIGIMYDQKACQTNHLLALETIQCNYLGLVSIMELLAAYFEKRKKGFISCVSSVAGDRGRQSNYVYGSTKGALTIYLQGLRNRLHPAGVHVQTIKPGPVATRMTEGLSDLPFIVPAEVVARRVMRALERREDVVYVPWIWSLIMRVVRLIPEPVFKRLRF